MTADLDSSPAIGRPRIQPLNTEHVVDSSLVPEGEAFLLKPRETTFGRAAQNDIVLLTPAVSRYHGRFLVSESDGFSQVPSSASLPFVTLEDYGSANGCRVNGEIVFGRRVLASGDLVEVGGVTLRFLA
jgi:pSer/pThr/pTyr-binding forkhead associated (FHA) protein